MSREDLKRHYKETPRPMGVYCVRNTASGDVFVWASSDIPAAFNRTRFSLQMGDHRNRELQGQWDDAGEPAFVFETLDTIEPSEGPRYDPRDDLTTLLDVWIERLEADGHSGRTHKAEIGRVR